MQFEINKDQGKFLRFYWPLGISKNPSTKVVEFWQTVLDFGLVCSPWLHCAGVRHHLDSEINALPQKTTVLQEIKQFFYMDDICWTADSVGEGKESVKLVSQVFNRGHFPLAKWNSNSKEIASFVQKASIAEPSAVFFDSTEVKFLGVSWNQSSDHLFINGSWKFFSKAVSVLSGIFSRVSRKYSTLFHFLQR